MNGNIIMLIKSLYTKTETFKERIRKFRDGNLFYVKDDNCIVAFEGMYTKDSFDIYPSEREELKKFLCEYYGVLDEEFSLLYHLDNLQKVCIPIWIDFCWQYLDHVEKITDEKVLKFLEEFEGGCDLVLKLLENVLNKAK